MGDLPEDMWSPYKYLQKSVQQIIAYSNETSIADLDLCLKKYKHTFATILRNPPKNEQNRMRLLNGITEGVVLSGHSRSMVLSKDLVDEAIIISDMFDVDELLALELLCTAQRHMTNYPGLPRGLVAVLLYYDGRKALAYSLSDLFQVTSGVSWSTDLPKDVTYLISSFTQSLVYDFNVLDRIVDILKELDIAKETALLTKNRALGTKKHQNQVLDLFEDIRRALAMSLFNWAAQRGLPRTALLKLTQLLLKYCSSEPSGAPDDVTIIMLMALLYSYDTTIVQRIDNSNVFSHHASHLPSDGDVGQEIYEVLASNGTWDPKNCLYSIVKFSFGLTLACLRHTPHAVQSAISKLIERDEQLINEAINAKVFEHIYFYILEKDIIYRNEFFYRRLHTFFTDFIELMHSKVTELRGKADETARIVMKFTKECVQPPANLDNSFEMLMLCIGKFYKDNKAGLSLCNDYWGPLDPSANVTKTTTRSVSLFKFVRLAGELLPSTLFVSYLRMIAGLTSCDKSARNAFNLLKQSSGLSGTAALCWEHFFDSLTRYYTNLRKENFSGIDTVYKQRIFSRSINPQEIEGLHAVLEVITSVCKYDDGARITMCEHPTWAAQHILLGLLTCAVPLSLKAQIIRTLSAMSLSMETALQLWNNLEASQIITTIPNTHAYTICNLEMEIEQNESRLETYELTTAVLELLHSLTTTVIPKNLGSGPRIPGLDPYFMFVLKVVFLKFNSRNYKNSSEKWSIGEKCLSIFDYLLGIYEISPQDFDEQRVENAPPGYHIMMQLNTKSDMLRMILYIIDEARQVLDQYSKFPGKKSLEQCALYSLKILDAALANQHHFFEAHSISNSSILLAGLNRTILDVNPRTKKPDYILNTTHFATYSAWLPRQSLYAVKVLHQVAKMPKLTTQILHIFSEDAQMQDTIRQGFVECLDNDLIISSRNVDDKVYSLSESYKIELQIKEAIIELLKSCLQHPAPNLSYFLLGFDVTKDPYVHPRLGLEYFDTNRNCLKSLVILLDNHLDMVKRTGLNDPTIERVVEQAYSLLFQLCCNPQTSDIVLRYLRSCNDFIYRHLTLLPLKDMTVPSALKQMSHLLKCTAIELKTTAMNAQNNRFQHLYELLMGTLGSRQLHKGNMQLEFNHFYSRSALLGDDNMGSTKTTAAQGKKITKMLLTYVFNQIELEEKEPEVPKWAYFDNNLTQKIFSECESVVCESGQKLINIQKLHEILNGEMQTVQNSIAAGQRKLILQEIETVLTYALAVNQARDKTFATIRLLEAWGQVSEILYICAPEAAVNATTKRELLLELVQKILSKMVPIQAQLDMSTLASEIILILLVNLRYCSKQRHSNGVAIDGDSSTATEADAVLVKTNGLSLKFIAKNLTEWIIVSGVKSQRLRINLYSALLYCLHLIKDNATADMKDSNTNNNYISRLDRVMEFRDESSIKMSKSISEADGVIGMELVASLNDKLIDAICHDTISSHDVCKMSALSCIDFLLDVDYFLGFLNSIASRGYLSHLIDSLLQSDEQLCGVLKNSPDHLRSLYVYESKMAMMLRLSSSHVGAEILLSERLLSVLSSMKVYDMLPDIQSYLMLRKDERNDFILSANERFQQIIFPVLRLCNSIMATLGSQNHSAVSQVMHFILSHCDMIEVVLRNGTPFMDLGSLKLLVAITGLIARTINQDIVAVRESANFDVSGNLFRIHRFMLLLLNRFTISQNLLRKMTDRETIMYDPTEFNKTLHLKYFLETVANLTLYCRNTVANHQADHRAHKILFLPKIAENIDSIENANNVKVVQNLGVILDQLKGSAEHFNAQKSNTDILMQQRLSLPNMNIEYSENTTHKELQQRFKEKQKELVLCTLIIEQCLYLLWIHLDFYMRNHRSSGPIRMDFFEGAAQKSSGNSIQLSTEDLNHLKKHLISTFNETFCKLLLSTTENLSDTDKRFNETLLRRILALIQMP